jgi:hypothetical protein
VLVEASAETGESINLTSKERFAVRLGAESAFLLSIFKPAGRPLGGGRFGTFTERMSVQRFNTVKTPAAVFNPTLFSSTEHLGPITGGWSGGAFAAAAMTRTSYLILYQRTGRHTQPMSGKLKRNQINPAPSF